MFSTFHRIECQIYSLLVAIILTCHNLKVRSWGWREGSAFMKIFYPSTGPTFGSQHLHRSSQLSVSSAPGDLTFLSSIHGPQACLRCTYIWVGNTLIHDKRKVNSSKHFFFKLDVACSLHKSDGHRSSAQLGSSFRWRWLLSWKVSWAQQLVSGTQQIHHEGFSLT